jgi:hypothetical protein
VRPSPAETSLDPWREAPPGPLRRNHPQAYAPQSCLDPAVPPRARASVRLHVRSPGRGGPPVAALRPVLAAGDDLRALFVRPAAVLRILVAETPDSASGGPISHPRGFAFNPASVSGRIRGFFVHLRALRYGCRTAKISSIRSAGATPAVSQSPSCPVVAPAAMSFGRQRFTPCSASHDPVEHSWPLRSTGPSAGS